MKINEKSTSILDLKVFVYAFLLWFFSVLFFIYFAFSQELRQIFKYSQSIGAFLNESGIFVLQFFQTIDFFVLFISIVFFALLFIYQYTYLRVLYSPSFLGFEKNFKKYGALGFLFTYLGFGCVACGQTLIYSILFFLGGTSAGFLAPYLGTVSLVFGSLVLLFGIRENYNIYKTKICKI
jgi:hypothetical protein